MIAETATTVLNIPQWVYPVFSVVGITFIFLLGYHCCTVHSICKEFPKIRRALDLISQKLFEKGFFEEHIYVSSASPIKLTDAGRQLLKDSNFEEFFKTNRNNFYKEVDAKAPKTPFEVEKVCRELMLYLDLDNTPKAELIKNYSYNNGRAIGDILLAYSVEVRDRYLQEHPNVKESASSV